MGPLKKLALRREVIETFRLHVAEGKSEAEAEELTLAGFKDKYGADVDWANLLKIIFEVIALLLRG